MNPNRAVGIEKKTMAKMKVPIQGQEQLELEEHANEPDVVPEYAAAPPSATADPAAPSATGVDEAIRTLQVERDALLDRLARLQAEFENARKRVAREQSDFKDFATAGAVQQFIPILDNFDLAMRNSATASAEDLRKGVELIRKQFESNLEKLGVTVIVPESQPFDPRLHEAVEMVESSDAPDNTVITVLQRGYKLKERLLRPAMVRVARNPGH